MPTIKIKRKTENFNENVDYKILVDGILITRLKNGEEKLIEVSENSKYISATLGSGRSEKLTIDNISEKETINVSGNEFMNRYLKYYGVIFPLLGLTFILDHDYELIKLIGKILFGILLLIAVYILIFMNKKWLILKT